MSFRQGGLNWIKATIPKKYKSKLYRVVWKFLRQANKIKKNKISLHKNKKNGKIDVYLISLPHRKDRRLECEQNFEKYDLPYANVNVIPGILEDEYPALGASKAHLKALMSFYFYSNNEYGIFLEDDFSFEQSFNKIISIVESLSDKEYVWDVLMLTGMSVELQSNDKVMDLPLKRLYSAQSGAGYVVKRSYIPNLINIFSQSVVELTANENIKNNKIMLTTNALDKIWNPLQEKGGWLICTPRFGCQRPSFSDIEKKQVNYNSSTY